MEGEGEEVVVRNRIVSLDIGAPGARVLAAVDLTGIQEEADRLSNLQAAVEHVWLLLLGQRHAIVFA